MAIALDTSATNTTTSFSYTCTGSNLALVVGVVYISATSGVASAMTYNSVNLTQIGSQVVNGNAQAQLFYLLGPATGANTLAFTSTGATSRCAYIASYTGVDQSAIDTSNSNSSASFSSTTPLSVALTTGVANDWIASVVAMAGSSATTEVSPKSPATSRQDVAVSTGAGAFGDLVTTTSGSNPFEWDRSVSTSRAAAAIALALKPFGSVPSVATWIQPTNQPLNIKPIITDY